MVEAGERAEYVLAGGSAELERLQLQARAWEPDAETLLDRVGVREGWSCLDVGCGAMGVLGPLARRVGSTGQVLGIDVDGKQLQAARAYLRSSGLDGVTVEERDAFRTGLPSGSFDFVHSRFLAAPTGRTDELLREMVRVARPGGVVALQEPDTSSWRCYPRHEAFDRLRDAIVAAFAQGGGDFDVGRDLFGHFRRIGLEDVRVRAAVLALQDGHPYMRLPVQFAASLRPRIVASGRMSERELDDAVAAIDRLVADPRTLMVSFLVLQVWGRTPRAPS